MKFIKFLVITLIIVAIAIFAGSPYYTVYQIKKTYDAHDGKSLVGYIDFDQLQPNIESQLTAKFSNTLLQYPLVAKLGGDPLNQAADDFISSSVSKAITADNISSLITTQGQANQATKELAATWAIASNKVNLRELIQDIIVQRGDINAVVKTQVQQVMDSQASDLKAHAEAGKDSKKFKLNYCGINCFTVSGEIKGYPVTVEMTRVGLVDWKIVNVVLP